MMKVGFNQCSVLLVGVLPGSAVVCSDTIEEAIAKPGRLPTDLLRDKRSKAQVIIPLLNYYNEPLAYVVGEQGQVLLHNNRGFKAWGINILNDGV